MSKCGEFMLGRRTGVSKCGEFMLGRRTGVSKCGEPMPRRTSTTYLNTSSRRRQVGCMFWGCITYNGTATLTPVSQDPQVNKKQAGLDSGGYADVAEYQYRYSAKSL